MLLNKKFLSGILAGCVSLLPMTVCKASTQGEENLTEILENEPYFADDESSQDSEEQRKFPEVVRVNRVQELVYKYMQGLMDLEFYTENLRKVASQNKRQIFYTDTLREIEIILSRGNEFLQRFDILVFATEKLNPVEYYEFVENLKDRLQQVSRMLYFVVDEIKILEVKNEDNRSYSPECFFDDNGFDYYI